MRGKRQGDDYAVVSVKLGTVSFAALSCRCVVFRLAYARKTRLGMPPTRYWKEDALFARLLWWRRFVHIVERPLLRVLCITMKECRYQARNLRSVRYPSRSRLAASPRSGYSNAIIGRLISDTMFN